MTVENLADNTVRLLADKVLSCSTFQWTDHNAVQVTMMNKDTETAMGDLRAGAATVESKVTKSACTYFSSSRYSYSSCNML